MDLTKHIWGNIKTYSRVFLWNELGTCLSWKLLVPQPKPSTSNRRALQGLTAVAEQSVGPLLTPSAPAGAWYYVQ